MDAKQPPRNENQIRIKSLIARPGAVPISFLNEKRDRLSISLLYIYL